MREQNNAEIICNQISIKKCKIQFLKCCMLQRNFLLVFILYKKMCVCVQKINKWEISF